MSEEPADSDVAGILLAMARPGAGDTSTANPLLGTTADANPAKRPQKKQKVSLDQQQQPQQPQQAHVYSDGSSDAAHSASGVVLPASAPGSDTAARASPMTVAMMTSLGDVHSQLAAGQLQIPALAPGSQILAINPVLTGGLQDQQQFTFHLQPALNAAAAVKGGAGLQSMQGIQQLQTIQAVPLHALPLQLQLQAMAAQAPRATKQPQTAGNEGNGETVVGADQEAGTMPYNTVLIPANVQLQLQLQEQLQVQLKDQLNLLQQQVQIAPLPPGAMQLAGASPEQLQQLQQQLHLQQLQQLQQLQHVQMLQLQLASAQQGFIVARPPVAVAAADKQEGGNASHMIRRHGVLPERFITRDMLRAVSAVLPAAVAVAVAGFHIQLLLCVWPSHKVHERNV